LYIIFELSEGRILKSGHSRRPVPKVRTNFRKVGEGQKQLDRFRQKWDGQKTGKCPILGTSLQGTFRGPDVNNENREGEIQVHLRKKPTSCACLLILLASMSNIEIHRTRLFLRMKGIPVAIEHSALTAAPFVKKITPYIHVS
jgi:hypothetical protein